MARSPRALGVALAALTVLTLCGCAPTLFPKDADRSVYDRHARLRNQYEPTWEFDAFGRRRPNLRGRLSNAR